MREIKTGKLLFKRITDGQALVEYALILALVALGFGFALAATGPVIGNVFSNTVYNLLGQTPEIREVAGPGDFWLTVTWVHENPVQERPLPTRTLAPPSSTPTDGPSPTPTPVTPTSTPLPTRTPAPTATPLDYAFYAPYMDTVDSPKHWRVDAEVFLGSADWKGYYFPGMELDYNGQEPTHPEGLWNRHVYGSNAYGRLNFPSTDLLAWQNSGSGPLNEWPATPRAYDYFSVRYVREIYVAEEVSLNFSLTSDDGSRLWILEPGQSAATCSDVPHPSTTNGKVQSGAPRTSSSRSTYGDTSAYPTDCLVIDMWLDQSATTASATRTLQPGHYRLQVDYYENTGGAELRLHVNIPSNPDDTRVENGNPVDTGGVDCNWGDIAQANDANSLFNMWTSYRGGSMPVSMRCHLELRGFIHIPVAGEVDDFGQPLTPIDRPELVFWDVWDMTRGTHSGWLEVAEYQSLPESDRAVDRDSLNWIRVDLHQGAARNYNWTRNVVDLRNVVDSTTGTAYDFRGKKLTLRFVMEINDNDAGATRRWYIDDIEVKDSEIKVHRAGTFWDLNATEHRDDFVVSGHWDLTANRAVADGEGGNPSSCCSWELSPNESVNHFSQAPGEIIPENLRVHYLEIDGWIDFTGGEPDDEGDEGWPLLSFFHAYNVRDNVGLEVQYTVNPAGVGPTNWQVIPGDPGDPPAGRIRSVNSTGYFRDEQLQPIDVTLRNLPNQPFRLRFVVMVLNRGQQDYGQGWWIDNIYLHREDPPRFLDYPFRDDAESGMDYWRTFGPWGRTAAERREGIHSFTDSPNGNYEHNANVRLEMAHPIDLRNDTPENLLLEDRNGAGGNSGGAAVDPVMTFWFRRDLARNDNFHVEWRRYGEPTNWRPLWSYIWGMQTVANTSSAAFSRQLAWEYVEIDLRPVLATFTADTGSDDIIFRFRLQTDGSNAADGVYIDDIRIEERKINEYKLWSPTEERNIGGQMYYGDGETFTANLEESDWRERWFAMGDWIPVNWEQRRGLLSWHESTLLQDRSPTGYEWPYPEGVTITRQNSLQILQISPVIDLRGTDASTFPTLYFWTRYHTGQNDRISVQISQELDPSTNLQSHMNNRCGGIGLSQCYEQNYGWGAWQNTAFNEPGWAVNYAWHRPQIDLTTYVGKRIRIRFIYNALETPNDGLRDGWYIDDVRVGPRENRVIRAISEGAFYDPARNMSNWIGEGGWGLSPEFFRGVGGGPTTLGIWEESLLYCGSYCGSNTGRWNTFMNNDGYIPGHVDAVPVTREVLDINYRLNSGEAPRPGAFNYTTNYGARFVMELGPIGMGINPGEYNFITLSDDGVRMKYEEINASGDVVDRILPEGVTNPSQSDIWNIIYNWTTHGNQTDMGAARLEFGKRYRITLEWFQASGGATMVVTTGGSSFSFTDTPKQGAGPSFPDIPAIGRGQYSLVLDGVLDLSNTTHPTIQYYTYYEVDEYVHFEISTDGGFTWTRSRLQDSIPLPLGGSDTFDDTRYRYVHMPRPGQAERDWMRKRHNFTYYRGQQIMMRFRMSHTSTSPRYDRETNNWYIGWWVVDITVADSG